MYNYKNLSIFRNFFFFGEKEAKKAAAHENKKHNNFSYITPLKRDFNSSKSDDFSLFLQEADNSDFIQIMGVQNVYKLSVGLDYMIRDAGTKNKNGFFGNNDYAWYNPKRWIYFSVPEKCSLNITKRKIVLGTGALLLTSYLATEHFFYDMANMKFLTNKSYTNVVSAKPNKNPLIININAFVDEEFKDKYPENWQNKIEKIVSESSDFYNQHFQIGFNLEEIRDWRSPNKIVSGWELKNYARNSNRKRDAEVMAFFTGQEPMDSVGFADAFGNYILVRNMTNTNPQFPIPQEFTQEQKQKAIDLENLVSFCHEMARIFGETRTDEEAPEGFIVYDHHNYSDGLIGFDEKTKETIQTGKNRLWF